MDVSLPARGKARANGSSSCCRRKTTNVALGKKKGSCSEGRKKEGDRPKGVGRAELNGENADSVLEKAPSAGEENGRSFCCGGEKGERKAIAASGKKATSVIREKRRLMEGIERRWCGGRWISMRAVYDYCRGSQQCPAKARKRRKKASAPEGKKRTGRRWRGGNWSRQRHREASGGGEQIKKLAERGRDREGPAGEGGKAQESLEKREISPTTRLVNLWRRGSL